MLWRSRLQQSTPPSSLAWAAGRRATGPHPDWVLETIFILWSVQPGRTGQSALAGWRRWCRCASHSRPSRPWPGTGRNTQDWWWLECKEFNWNRQEELLEEVFEWILPTENTSKHVLCCLLKPVSNGILKLLVPDKWCCLWNYFHSTYIFVHNCTIDSPLHVATSRGMDSSTSSSHIWVPFHQINHLQIEVLVTSQLGENTGTLTLIMASGWKSTSPSRASKNVFSALTFAQPLIFISFSPKSKQLVDPPLFGRLSTKGYPSIGGQGSSTCTWSGTTWNPSSFECFKGHLPFLVPDLVFVFQVADNFCFPRQSPDLKEEVEVLDITRSQRVLPDVLRKAWQSSLVAGCEASSSRTWSFLKMSCQ